MNRDFVGALLQLNAGEAGPPRPAHPDVEDAIQSAYRRTAGDEDIHVRIDAETGQIRVFRAKLAVAEVEDPLTEFSLEEAKARDPNAQLGDLVDDRGDGS